MIEGIYHAVGTLGARHVWIMDDDGWFIDPTRHQFDDGARIFYYNEEPAIAYGGALALLTGERGLDDALN